MTQMVEFDLARVLESMDQKLNRVLEAQTRLEGKVETLDVKFENLQKGQDELTSEIKDVRLELKETKDELTSEIKDVRLELTSEIKDVRLELKETRNDISSLYKWLIGLIIAFGTGIITLGIGVVTIIFRVFDLFPKA